MPRERATRVGVLSLHNSMESKALLNAAAALGAEPVWLGRGSLELEVDESVTVDPPVDVVINRLLLSKQADAAEALGLTDALSRSVPVLNRPDAVLRALNKLATAAALVEAEILVPRAVLALRHDRLVRPREGYTDPVAYKTTVGTHGLGTAKAWLGGDRRPDPLYGTRQAMVQRLVDPGDDRHWDRRMYVVGDRAVAAMDRYAPPDDWRTNIARGGEAVDATGEMTPELEQLAVRAAQAVGLDFAGVDAITDGDRWYVLEVNPTAGFKGLFGASGVSPAPYVVALALETVGESVDETLVAEAARTLDDELRVADPFAEPPSSEDTVGFIERVVVSGAEGHETVFAKSDTGADRTVIDYKLAAAVGTGPITGTIKVRSGTVRMPQRRLLAEAVLGVHGDAHTVEVGLEDRSGMDYPVLLGRDVLRYYRVDITRRADRDGENGIGEEGEE